MDSGHSELKKSKEEVHHTDLGAAGELKVQAWYRWTVGAWQLMEDPGWKMGNCEYFSLEVAPILTKS